MDLKGPQPRVKKFTAQILNDNLYVYGGADAKTERDPDHDLWSFDLSNRDVFASTWTKCVSSGEKPGPSLTHFAFTHPSF